MNTFCTAIVISKLFNILLSKLLTVSYNMSSAFTRNLPFAVNHQKYNEHTLHLGVQYPDQVISSHHDSWQDD